MSIKSIILHTPEVQAILSGRQTQLRRVIMPANRTKAKRMGGYSQGNGLWVGGDDKGEKAYIKDYSVSPCWQQLDCYIQRFAPCKPGDILWVRETWERFNCMCCDGDNDGSCFTTPDEMEGCYVYRASHAITGDAQWHPSIHMPKAAARLFLRVTDVRAEQLQDISYDGGDIWAQGIPSMHDRLAETNAFIEQWNARNDKRGYGWDTNPWVWVYTFERTDRPENWPEGR